MDEETTKKMTEFFQKQIKKINQKKWLDKLVEAGGANHETRYMKSVIQNG